MNDRRILRTFAALMCGIWLSLFSAGVAHAQWTPMNPVKSFQQESDGAVLHHGNGHAEDPGVLGFGHPCAVFAHRDISKAARISS